MFDFVIRDYFALNLKGAHSITTSLLSNIRTKVAQSVSVLSAAPPIRGNDKTSKLVHSVTLLDMPVDTLLHALSNELEVN